MHSQAIRRHWADHPVGRHADRAWRSGPSTSTKSDDDEEVYWTSDPPSDQLRAANALPFRPYVYGASPEHLRPLDERGILKPEFKPAPDVKPIKIPKPTPKPVPEAQNPDTFKPPAAPPPVPFDQHPPCVDPDCDDPLYCWHEWEAPKPPKPKKSKRLERLEKENQELREKLEALQRATPQPSEPVPLYVRPFVCSACDPGSPMFTTDHRACIGAECACYTTYREAHDRRTT